MCLHNIHDVESRLEPGQIVHSIVCNDCREPIKEIGRSNYKVNPNLNYDYKIDQKD